MPGPLPFLSALLLVALPSAVGAEVLTHLDAVGQAITCDPASTDCTIECHGSIACADFTLTCPTGAGANSCTVSCVGSYACQRAVIDFGNSLQNGDL